MQPSLDLDHMTDAERLIAAIESYRSALFELAGVDPISEEKIAQAERLAKLNQTEFLH